MRKHLLLTVAALCWVATGTLAADNAAKTGSSPPAPAAQAEMAAPPPHNISNDCNLTLSGGYPPGTLRL